jgi:hypothetical protein
MTLTTYVLTLRQPDGRYAVGMADLDSAELGAAARQAHAAVLEETPDHTLVKITNIDTREHIDFGDAGPVFPEEA